MALLDRQAGVVLQGTTASVVVYSYAHLPLLMGLAATSAGVRLLILRAGADSLGYGASTALIGGIVVFLLALVATRSVTVSGPRRVGVTIKLAAVAAMVVLFAVQSVLPPLVLAAALALVLGAAVYAERTLIPGRA